MRGLFVAGTDTEVGKTYFTALLATHLRDAGINVGAYKPACSGAVPGDAGKPAWDDIEQLWKATGSQFDRARICPQRFLAPLAPPVAAAEEGRTVDTELLRSGCRWWQENVDLLLVESAGGLLSPIADTETVADLAADLQYPVVIVARLTLGTINHTLMTVEVAQSRGLPIAGVLLNQTDPQADPRLLTTNEQQLRRWLQVPVLGRIDHAAAALPALKLENDVVDWEELAR